MRDPSDLNAIIRRCVGGDDIFPKIVCEIKNSPLNTIAACKRDNQRRGALWEKLCVEYLRHVGYESVQRFEDVDDALKTRLGLQRRDMGIDIICTRNGEFVAVQCKFRSKRMVTWTEIATFEALCARSGPWAEHVVMTNCSFIKREGSSTKDVNITYNVFKALKRHEWLSIGGMGKGRTISDGVCHASNIRERWLARLETSTPRHSTQPRQAEISNAIQSSHTSPPLIDQTATEKNEIMNCET